MPTSRTMMTYFYPRPPRGGRPGDLHPVPYWKDISIHALREEGDLYHETLTPIHYISIHALREEGDLGTAALVQPKEISIHALREEGDPLTSKPKSTAT